ncbi:hypothetical protein AZE42_03682 [Rhizopogon vesiculosus]|uniref:Uncharacterized protein n=1 Tax=Rhizopogon vesiculosus TaxID=180088 RepID=A0A1J8PJG0_9AGAM|nr:hypothetical protein AZE42_03682 [Rhizopogon vesiculosus]
MSRFTQFDEDSYRLPEGVKRIAYDADTQQYAFRDPSGQLYQNAPGEKYGVLKPVSALATPRRRVTITERRDPALIRARSIKHPAKTFDDFLPPEYITNAEDTNSVPNSPIDKIARVTRKATLSKIPGVVTGAMRRRTSSPRSSVDDEKHYLLDDRSSSSPSYVDEEKKTLARSTSNHSLI